METLERQLEIPDSELCRRLRLWLLVLIQTAGPIDLTDQRDRYTWASWTDQCERLLLIIRPTDATWLESVSDALDAEISSADPKPVQMTIAERLRDAVRHLDDPKTEIDHDLLSILLNDKYL